MDDVCREIKHKSISLLARREYSYQELYQRFKTDYPLEKIEVVLQQLIDDGYQSDQRFAESFIRNKVSQNQGPAKIKYAIRSKGIPETLFDNVIEMLEPDWYSMAAEIVVRKYFSLDISDRKQQAKIVRFCTQRGFSIEHALTAIDVLKEEQSQEH